MTKHELAKQLREKILEDRFAQKEVIDLLDDDQIIGLYNTRACCDDKILSAVDLELAINSSNSAEEFLEISKSLECQNKVISKN
jgi:hypothetical protein